MPYESPKAKWCGRELSHNATGQGLSAISARTSTIDYTREPAYRARTSIPIRPLVWWYVRGRKMFDQTISPVIRGSWKIGRYPVGAST